MIIYISESFWMALSVLMGGSDSLCIALGCYG